MRFDINAEIREMDSRNKIIRDIISKRPNKIERICSLGASPFSCYLRTERGDFYEPDMHNGLFYIDFCGFGLEYEQFLSEVVKVKKDIENIKKTGKEREVIK